MNMVKELQVPQMIFNLLFSWATISFSIRTVLPWSCLDLRWISFVKSCMILLIVEIIFCCWYNLWRVMCQLSIHIIIWFPLEVYVTFPMFWVNFCAVDRYRSGGEYLDKILSHYVPIFSDMFFNPFPDYPKISQVDDSCKEKRNINRS
jgi:hypothetical protein